MVEETKLAKEYNYKSPILGSLEMTHLNYDKNMEFILNHIGNKSEVRI